MGQVASRRGRLMVGGVMLLLAFGCGRGSSSPPAAPTVQDINSSTSAASPVDVAIEINGSSFQSAPGEVRFTQGTNVAQVVPLAAAWSDTNIVVRVPSTGSTGTFTVPGTVSVTVHTSGGISNSVDLALVQTPVFSVGNVQWALTTPLPKALRGLRAEPIPVDATRAYVVVAGGNDGSANVATVLSGALGQDGQIATWSTTTSLPSPRAHHGMVAAHPANTRVAASARYVYVIAGQEKQSDTPGGTATVYYASVSTLNGSVGAWATTPPLPRALVGPAVTLYNGYIHVVGGLLSDGTRSSAVYSAPVGADGKLGAWETSAKSTVVPLAFADCFGFGGSLYLVGGDAGNSTDPNEQGGAGIASVQLAPVSGGVVGTWTFTSAMVKGRKKHNTWTAFGQVLGAEGVYNGSPGSVELERTLVLSDGTLGAWNGITANANQIHANVYNAATLVSPIRPPNAGPRFLLLGGQAFATSPPGALSNAVYYNTAP